MPFESAALRRALPNATIARAASRDAGELLVLQRACWVEEALANDRLDIPALTETLREVRVWSLDWRTIVVRRGARLVAAVRARRFGSDWEIGRLMVAPDLAGRGIGRALLELIEGEAPEGTDRIVLHTGEGSARNLRLYERAGYARLDDPEVRARMLPARMQGIVVLAKLRGPAQNASSARARTGHGSVTNR